MFLQIDLNTTEGQIQALKNPAINVRYEGFKKLRSGGSSVVEQVKELLKDQNPYVKARATWLLSGLGDEGRREVEKLLDDENEMIRATAYRALRQTVSNVMPYANKMYSDTSSFVRREVAVSLTDVPYADKKQILLSLAASSKDRWMLETIGKSLEGHGSEIYPEIKKVLHQDVPSTEWNNTMSMLAWRLHPVESVNDFAARAKDTLLSIQERKNALTALGFTKNNAAIKQLKILCENGNAEIAVTAKFWMAFLVPGSVEYKESAPPAIAAANKNTPHKKYIISDILLLKPDVTRGQQLFTSNCRTCHKAGKEGSTIAPDLTFVSKKYDDKQLLNSIINPSEAVAFGYEPWMISTKDKKTYFGFLISDNEESMIIRDISGINHLIKKMTVATAKKEDKSLMPEPSQLGLTEQNLADIISYLKQVK